VMADASRETGELLTGGAGVHSMRLKDFAKRWRQ
jgi:hypothetical protein